MARNAEGWKLRTDRRTGIIYVRFRHQKKRYEITTGSRDPVEAAKEAPGIYAETISGRRSRGLTPLKPGQPLELLAADWLASVETECDPKTLGLYEIHLTTHLIPFFKTLERIVPPIVADYRRTRLKRVIRETVCKELTTLRRFLKWCKEEGYLSELPIVEDPPLSTIGTEDVRVTKNGERVKHKRVSVPVSETEALAIVAALPERSKRARRGKGRHVVRDFFDVLWETGLRPETLAKLAAPTNYRRGTDRLQITKNVDKVRYVRDLPLTPRARAALDRCAPDSGLIFGRHDYRVPFREACKAALGNSWKAEAVTPYDFRHGRTTHLLEQPGAILPGVSYLVGHKQVTTTNRYVHAGRAAAEKTLALGGIRGARRGTGKRDRVKSSCEGGDLNPHASYGASTSREKKRAGSGKSRGLRKVGKSKRARKIHR